MQKGLVRNPALVLVFTLLSCGIYYLYWFYKISEETQRYMDQEVKPGTDLLLLIFTCGIYGIYWYYKMGKTIADCQQKAGIRVEDNSVLYLILAICGGLGSLINPILIQSSLNKVWEAKA